MGKHYTQSPGPVKKSAARALVKEEHDNGSNYPYF